ncbi:MAG: hypothetical protein A2017_18950 [Lentisphaerae bacterium GWF2_44_16]|nr:MAG: hypothetical protein A2017_18950 [Lentisphaerae bacterium GWF2_44_16]
MSVKEENILRKNIPIPRYYQLAEHIRKAIQENKFPKGEPLWSERNLMGEYKISLATVRKAYEILFNEGLILKEQGRGIFVADRSGRTVTLKAVLNTMIFPEKVWMEIIREFNRIYPHVRIDCIWAGGARGWGKNIDRLQPDIYSVDEAMWYILNKADLLLDIADFVKQDIDTINGIYENVLNCYKKDNCIFGIPYRFSTFALFYNKKIFRKYNIDFPEKGISWETLLDIAEKLTVLRNNGSIKHYGFISNGNINNMSTYIWQNGGDFSPYTLSSFNDKNVKEAISFWYYDMLYKHKVSPAWGIVDAIDLFLKDKVAMFCERYYSVSLLNKKCDFEWGVAPLPHGKLKACSLPSQALSISKKTKNVVSAWNFIKFISTLETQKLFSNKGWGLPSQKVVAESMPYNKYFIEQLRYARPAWPSAFTEPREIIKEEFDLLRLNMQNAEITCNKIARRCEKIKDNH